jgi:hypothetical protein
MSSSERKIAALEAHVAQLQTKVEMWEAMLLLTALKYGFGGVICISDSERKAMLPDGVELQPKFEIVNETQEWRFSVEKTQAVVLPGRGS